jgi:sulfotransferase family protein
VIERRPGHLLVIGAQRSGSSYLSTALDAHPQITMARPAWPEPKVFCDSDRAARGLEWYHETWFAHARDELLLGDKSTSYLEDPKAPARAADLLGEVQVVAVLRDPVQRAVSNWRFSTRHGLETRPLEVALRADLEAEQPWDRTRTSVSPFAYVRRGRYLEHLVPWTATFPDTTHVVLTEELLADPTVLDGLFRDLGVDPDLAPAPPGEPVNTSVGDPPVLSDALVGTLQSYFEASNAALGAHLGRTLPW